VPASERPSDSEASSWSGSVGVHVYAAAVVVALLVVCAVTVAVCCAVKRRQRE